MQPNKSGLSQVFDDNRAALLRFLTARSRDPALAEDLLQDIWIKLGASKPSGPIDSPLSYLYKMCENAVRDSKRSEARKRARETLWSETVTDIGSDRSDNLTPEKIALERDGLKNVLLELEKLPDRTRKIFVDFRVNEITQKQIAQELGISVSAVEKHLQRAYRVIMDYREKDDAGMDGS